MTRKICVNRNYFEKGIGYGLWGFLTITMLFFTFGFMYEVSTQEMREQDIHECKHYAYDDDWNKVELDEPDCWDWVDKDYCREMFLRDITVCKDDYQWEKYDVSPQLFYFIINIINFVVIGLWIYNKQQKFKLSWCEGEN